MSPSGFIWIPDGHPGWIPAFLLQLGAGAVLFWIERYGGFLLPRRDEPRPRIPGTVLVALVPPMVVYLWTYVAADAPSSAYHVTLLLAVCVLFLRRFVEALWFRRQLAGDLIEVSATSAGYTAFALVAGFLHNGGTLPEATEGWLSSYVTAIGIVFFVVGVLLNTTQHRQLALGRPLVFVPGEDRGWKAWLPEPHYLGEILAWLGFAVLSRQLAVYGFALMMTCLIVARGPLRARALSDESA